MVKYMGANGLIGATYTLLSDYFWGMFLKKSLHYFVKVCVKNLSKNVIFKVFQVYLKIILLLKNNGYNSFYITFEGPNVNEIISYFEHL